MTDTLILDASIVCSWFINKEPEPYACEVRKAMEAGTRALTPATWILDVADKLITAERETQVKKGYVNQALTLLGQLPIQSQTTLPRSGLTPIIRLAQSENINMRDAPYLELALNKSLPLATIDADLRDAANKLGVSLFDPTEEC